MKSGEVPIDSIEVPEIGSTNFVFNGSEKAIERSEKVTPQNGSPMETIGKFWFVSKRPSCKRVAAVYLLHSSRG